MSAAVEIRAAYASVVEDDEDGMLFIGFAEGEEEDEPYALFRQPIGGGPVWFEVSDESFGAEDAVQSVAITPDHLTITLRPAVAALFGWARSVTIHTGPECEDGAQAISALREMLGDIITG